LHYTFIAEIAIVSNNNGYFSIILSVKNSNFVVVLFNITTDMKKKIIYLMFLSCLLSCSKNDDVEDLAEAEKVQVLFSVKTLNVDVQPMDSPQLKSLDTKSAANSILTDIHYYFFNTSNSELVTSGSQSINSDAANFGKLSIMLTPGTYNAIFIGNTANNQGGTFSMNLGTVLSSASGVSVTDKEVFYTNTTYTITPNSTSENVDLSRLVGKLILRLTDTNIPSYIGKINAQFNYLPRFLPMYNESATNPTGGGSDLNKDLSFTDSQISEMDVFLLPQTLRTLKITIYDEDNKELASTQVIFSIYSNKRTIIQGNILDVINQKDFNITVSDEWDSDVIVPIQ
jgi:hypothetical protein